MIKSFKNEYDFLSNFYPATIPSTEEGPAGVWTDHVYASVEHAYQAFKTTDQEAREPFRTDITAARAKKLGKKLVIRPDWESVKLRVMQDLVKVKFGPSHPELAERLLATGDEELIEGNWWGDTYWGVCRGAGENHLGKILMGYRSYLNHLRKQEEEKA